MIKHEHNYSINACSELDGSRFDRLVWWTDCEYRAMDKLMLLGWWYDQI